MRVGAVLEWLVAVSLQTTVLVALIAAVERAARGRLRPELRHGLWMLVAVKLVLPPGLPAIWSGVVPLRPAGPIGGAGASAAAGPPAWPALVWAAGALVAAAIAWRRAAASRRTLLHGSHVAGPGVLAVAERVGALVGLTRTPAVRLCPGLSGPLVLGPWRPVVLLPAEGVAGWSTPELEHVLGHELAHIRRGDLWLEAAFTVLNAVYWFHPLVYVARRRAHRLRELCCDATVATRLGPGYRATLLRLAADRYLAPAGAAGMWSGGSLILTRLRALEGHATPRSPRLTTAAALVLAGVTLLPMGAGRGEAAARELANARSAVARAAADSAGIIGSMHMRYAVQRLNAVEGRRETGEGRGEW